MSRYGDKHQSRPICAIITCEAVATTLKTQRGVLDWWCDEHSDLVQVVKDPRTRQRH